MKALALFSGGLDSSLAIKVIQNQGIEVIALNFVSHFFGGYSEKSEKMAEQLGVRLEYIDFKERHRQLVENPPSGYGKNMNPCIDCHALMIRVAGEMMEEYGADFIITGEVMGQRPMSQNKSALNRVEKLSGKKGYVVRPLSGKILPPTIPEEKGWIKREGLLDIQGRGRKKQMAYAEEIGLVEYEMPGGGCLLTEPNFSKRLKLLKDDGVFDKDYVFDLIRTGRLYRLDAKKYLIVGRDQEQNEVIDKYIDKADLFIRATTTPGPRILGIGDFSEEEVYYCKQLFARYSKSKGQEDTPMSVNQEEVLVPVFDTAAINEWMEKYIVK